MPPMTLANASSPTPLHRDDSLATPISEGHTVISLCSPIHAPTTHASSSTTRPRCPAPTAPPLPISIFYFHFLNCALSHHSLPATHPMPPPPHSFIPVTQYMTSPPPLVPISLPIPTTNTSGSVPPYKASNSTTTTIIPTTMATNTTTSLIPQLLPLILTPP